MKIIKNITFLLLAVFVLASCEPEDPIESSVTEYAEFEMTGGEYMFVDAGSAYEEPGVIATSGEEELEVEVTGSVDTETPGVYKLTYTAINAEGFPATTSRYVAVGDKAVVEQRDLSGTYSPSNTLVKLADGFYQASDILPANNLSALMVDLGNGEIIVPLQSSRFGNVVVDPTVNADSSGMLTSEDSFTLNIKITGYNIFVRTFTK